MEEIDALAKIRASGALPSEQQREREHQERTQRIAKDLEEKSKLPPVSCGPEYTFHSHPGAP